MSQSVLRLRIVSYRQNCFVAHVRTCNSSFAHILGFICTFALLLQAIAATVKVHNGPY